VRESNFPLNDEGDFPQADPVGKFTVFNIKNNEYRLITVIHYNRFKVFIRHLSDQAASSGS
jgi:mRNA-degrading endonuclease HigB of HigAB toxin-antitoxin module